MAKWSLIFESLKILLFGFIQLFSITFDELSMICWWSEVFAMELAKSFICDFIVSTYSSGRHLESVLGYVSNLCLSYSDCAIASVFRALKPNLLEASRWRVVKSKSWGGDCLAGFLFSSITPVWSLHLSRIFCASSSVQILSAFNFSSFSSFLKFSLNHFPLYEPLSVSKSASTSQ